MLMVISNPTPIANEANLINGLFDEGLEIFHLRKPNSSIDEMKSLLEKIKPKFYHQISLHQQHEIVNDFGIKRLHFTELNRLNTDERSLKYLNERNHILSTSIHEVKVYQTLTGSFEYTFFGPVFNSISKPGYTSSLSGEFIFPNKTGHPKVIAIGGIDVTNIQRVKQMNFSGAAVLGTIWANPKESIARFKMIQKSWKQTGQ